MKRGRRNEKTIIQTGSVAPISEKGGRYSIKNRLDRERKDANHMNAVECENLVKTFGGTRAIDGLTVQIAENRITGLIGRNGAGKTTLLKLAAGYWKPTGGSIRVMGENPFNSVDVSYNCIYVDDKMTFPGYPLSDIIAETAKFYRNFDRDLAFRLLDYYSFDQKKHLAKLSKGMQSTFYSILGICARAALTIFDEPTTGMDAAARKDFYRALLREYIAFPRTVILSSHLLGELSGLLEDILLLDGGRLAAMMSADEASTFAVSLRGPEQAVLMTAGSRQVLHRSAFAPGSLYLAVRGQLTPREAAEARERGVEPEPVKADDLCIYLTQKNKRGIDDALTRE